MLDLLEFLLSAVDLITMAITGCRLVLCLFLGGLLSWLIGLPFSSEAVRAFIATVFIFSGVVSGVIWQFSEK